MSDTVYKSYECLSCGHKWLAKSAACPNCNSFGKSLEDSEFTKKVVDDNDLRKSF